jgi:hypothetical protein
MKLFLDIRLDPRNPRLRMQLRRLLLILVVCASTTASAPQRAADPDVAPQTLAKTWDAEHVSPALPPLTTHADVVKRLEELAAHGDLFRVEKVGESVEGRALNLVQVGSGSFGVLLWSQMHGDEPTATAALFDLFEYLRRHRDEPHVRRILSALTLYAIPMLNPDGAERFQRRNAQSIDINRDALRLQTPEGRTLKAVRDRFTPRIGFNLHNQAWRTSVGEAAMPASISLLSVAFDEARSNSPGRTLTKKVCAIIRDALEPFASGQIGRYDDSFEVRAFGDNITLWGTPVVLIETGPWPSAEPDPALIKLNFVALVSALDALAAGTVERADPRRYESLPMNESRLLYLLISNASVINGDGVPPFIADVGIAATRRVREADGRRQLQLVTTIDDMGDLRRMNALRAIDGTGMTVIPLANDGIDIGQIVDLPEWKAKQSATLAVGQSARLALVKPAAAPGKYQVELVLK